MVVGTNTRALWPALADALLMFPFTKDARLALLNLLCSQQVSSGILLISSCAAVAGIGNGCITVPQCDASMLDLI